MIQDLQPRTTRELLDRAREAYDRLLAAIASLRVDIEAPSAIGSWSVRDVIAHVGSDEGWMAGQMEALQSGQLPTAMSCYGSDAPLPEGMNLDTQDARNAWQHERLRNLSLEEVRVMATDGHARLFVAMEAFSDEQLGEELTIATLGTMGHIRKPKAGEQGWPLWRWLAGVTYKHYDDHAEAIRALTAER